MARPAKLTPQIQARIVQAIQGGNTRKTAAAFAGIDESTLYRWLARGKVASAGSFREFYEAVEKGEADAIVTSVATVRLAAQKSWQAAAWWLERKYPDEWALRQPGVQQQLEDEVKKLAEEFGLDVAEVMGVAEKLLAQSR